MSITLENARIFNETQQLLEKTRERAEEQACTSQQLRKRSLYLAGAFAVVLVAVSTILNFIL